ncbi:MAG: rhomboid family intramembrane serine protease [bacterium]|jgi:membrane associated rhomboid family serine protease
MFGHHRHQPQRNIGDIFRKIFLSRNVLSRIMLINLLVFGLVAIIDLVIMLFSVETMLSPRNPVIWLLALPSNLSDLAFKPWTLLTYMFLHQEFFHILVNLFMIYVGGIIFLEYLNEKKLLWTYILGGLTGAVFFVIAFNIFPVFQETKQYSILLGASASGLAILIAIATYVPDYSIHLLLIGRVKLKYIAIVFVVIDILSIPSGNAGGHIGHLGGAFWGFIYAFALRGGHDFYRIFDRYRITFSSSTRKSKKFDTFRNKESRPMSDEEFNKRKAAEQEEIDRILEKISKGGYDSLTKAEKELLFKSSKKD